MENGQFLNVSGMMNEGAPLDKNKLNSQILKQWFLNFFERDPNLSFMNISQPKPQTSKNVFLMLALCYFFR